MWTKCGGWSALMSRDGPELEKESRAARLYIVEGLTASSGCIMREYSCECLRCNLYLGVGKLLVTHNGGRFRRIWGWFVMRE